MLILDKNKKIDGELFFSQMMKRKCTVPLFRLPYTAQQAYAMLLQSYRAEVVSRHRSFLMSPDIQKNIADAARWLTSSDSTFGLFLCGGAGNGKTSLLRAVSSLINYCLSVPGDSPYPSNACCREVTAKQLVPLAKAAANPSRENNSAVLYYNNLVTAQVLCIDDIGTEARESMYYGDYVTAVTDVILYRYDAQLCTLLSTNLSAGEISQYYDARISDRFREMMHVINFGNQSSFRTL